MSTLRSFTTISVFNLQGAWTGLSLMFFGRVICTRQFWTMSHFLTQIREEHHEHLNVSTTQRSAVGSLALC